MEIDWKAIEPWILGGGGAALFTWLGRAGLKVLGRRSIVAAQKDQGELLLHGGYANFIKLLTEERQRQDKKMLEAATKCEEDMANIRKRCAEDMANLEGQLEALKTAIARLERQNAVKDIKLEALKNAIGLGGGY